MARATSTPERPRFASPIAAVSVGGTSSSVHLNDETGTAIRSIRAAADGDAAADLGVAFGRAERRGDYLIVGIRPGEWLTIGPAPDGTASGTSVDLTHGRVVIRVSGERATSLLEKVCSLDFGDTMFPRGAAASASVAKVGCDIIRDDANSTPSYLLTGDRSYGQYLFDALIDAGREFGVAVD